MTNSKYGKLIYVLTSAFLVLLGIGFIVCCAHLFFTGGENPYSRESVGKYLIILLVPSIITIIAIVAGFIHDSVTGAKQDLSAQRTNTEMLSSFSARIDESQLSSEARTRVINERTGRMLLSYLLYALSAVLAICAIIFILKAEFTVENLNGDVLSAFAIVLPLLVGSVAIHIPRVHLAEASAKRELEILKNEVKNGVKLGKPVAFVESENEKTVVLTVKIIVLFIGVLFIILGIFNGGMTDVLDKAVKICTECIGLG